MNLGKVGFILDGGGFAGAYSIGFLKALAEKGIKPEYVQGFSVGALNAAKFVETGGDVDQLIKKWMAIQERGPSSIFSRTEILFNLRGSALFSNQRIVHSLIGAIDFNAILNSPMDLHIVTWNEGLGEQQVFSNRDEDCKNIPGRLADAILASASPPFVLPPVPIAGDWYSDGVVFKISSAIQAKCDTIFVFCNSRLFAEGGIMLLHHRAIYLAQCLGYQLAIRKIEYAIERGYQLIQNVPLRFFKDIKPLGVIKQKLTKMVGDIAEMVADPSEALNIFTPHRIVLLVPPALIPTLRTISFKMADPKRGYAGDIALAIEQCSKLPDEFWNQF